MDQVNSAFQTMRKVLSGNNDCFSVLRPWRHDGLECALTNICVSGNRKTGARPAICANRKTGARPAICAILNRCRSELFDEVGRKIMGFYIFPCAATDPIKSEIAQIAGLTPISFFDNVNTCKLA